jgi:iron complex outermembrane receptor protein
MGSLDLNANLYYNSGFFFTPDNNTEQGAYAQVSASGTWTAPDGRLSVGAWGKNLTDKRVATYESVNTGNGTFNLTYQAPRMYGLTVGYKF